VRTAVRLELLDPLPVRLADVDDARGSDEQRAFVRVEVLVVGRFALELHEQRPAKIAAPTKHVAIEPLLIGEHAHTVPRGIVDLARPAAGGALAPVADLAATYGTVRVAAVIAARLAAELRAAAASALVTATVDRALPRLGALAAGIEQPFGILVCGLDPEVTLPAYSPQSLSMGRCSLVRNHHGMSAAYPPRAPASVERRSILDWVGQLPVTPPIAPMLARRADSLPSGDYLYEPKWDGFRCIAFRARRGVDLRSRNDRPLARYFPELVDELLALGESGVVLDGEVVVAGAAGYDFDALLGRIHPAASRVERLSRETPARFIVFDLLARDDEDLRTRRFDERRAMLEEVLTGANRTVAPTPVTELEAEARRWLDCGPGSGIDGVVAKRVDLRYEAGARRMVKVKRERTADCVVAGFRPYVDRPLLSSLLLGLYDEAGELRHIGTVTAFTRERRRRLLEELAPLAVPLPAHPWEHGFLTGGSSMGRLAGAAARWSPAEMELDWVPIAPDRVCEVAFDHLDRDRLRHPARFRRWRPDRDPRSCTFEQLEPATLPA
jgi:ATP-dependent DNA ligase